MRQWARVLSVVCLVLVSACTAVERPEGTVVLASGADLESGNPLVTIHPLSRQVQRFALYVTLVRLDSLLQPQPYFARSWEWDSTHTRLSFKVHSDLRWHDGVQVTAKDVAFTFNALKDSVLAAPRRGDMNPVVSVEAADDTTVLVQFAHAMSGIPVVFAELPVAPMHILDSMPRNRWRTHPFATNPVGNGPFVFAERVAGRRWRFTRNADFPESMGGPPALQQLIVAVVDEPSTKFAGLVSGELDMAGVSPAMAHLVAHDPKLELLTPPVLFTTLVAFNTTRAPFNDVRVRRAVSASIDRARIVNVAVAGFGEAAGGALPSGIPMSVERLPLEDTSLADSLLDAAGWLREEPRARADESGNTLGTGGGYRMKDGARLTITLLTVGSGDQAVEQLLQDDLRARGIDVRIRVAEMVTFLTIVRGSEKDFDFAFTGIPGDIAAGHIKALFATSLSGGALDYTGWHNSKLDSALLAVELASSTGEKKVKWSAVDSILDANAPVAWIYHAKGVQGKSVALRNVRMDVRGELVNVTEWARAARVRD